MSKIGDLVRDAQVKYAKAQKANEAIERVRESIKTIHELGQLKGKT